MSSPKRKQQARPVKRPESPPALQAPSATGRQRPVWLLLPALLAAVLLAYSPAWHGGMLWDDNAHITAPALRTAGGLWRIWFDVSATQQYYPVTHSAFWLMNLLWGDHTLGYHLANIFLHALSAFLLAWILRRLSIPGAYFAAFLFAMHPVFVESVAWISELKNTLSGVFFLGAVLVYLRFDEDRKRQPYVVALALFLLALLSKSVTATLPGVLLVIFWWQRGTLSLRRDLAPLAPFFVAGVSAGLFTSWVERAVIGAEGESFSFTFFERCLIAGRAVWFYLAKLCWPANLIFLYPKWRIDAAEWRQVLYPLALVVFMAALWWLRGKSRAPLAAMLLFCGMLFPALGFFNVYPFVFSFVADHFQYLAGIAILTLFSAFSTRIARSWKPWFTRPAAALAIGGLLAFLTWNQSHQYGNAETLYRDTLARNPSSWLAQNNLGSLLLSRSNAEIEDGVAHLREAIRLKPDYAGAWMNLGNALRSLGQLEDALAAHEKAVALNRNIPAAHANLGLTLRALGRQEEAIAQYKEAVRLEPDFADAHLFLGEALQDSGRLEESLNEIEDALRLNPRYPEAHNALANVYVRSGRLQEAIAEYGAALSLKPDYAAAHTNLGVAYGLAGRLKEAVAEHEEALRLRPGFQEAHLNLGKALLALGRTDDGAAQLREVIRLEPKRPEPYPLLAAALQKTGKTAEAVQVLEEGVRNLPYSARAHDDFAAALLDQGRTGEAMTQIGEALRLDPGYAPAHLHLGNLLQAMGRPGDAISHYQEALRAKPDDPDIHNALGAALAATGRLEEAVVQFEEALRLYPDYSAARSNLTRARALLGRK